MLVCIMFCIGIILKIEGCGVGSSYIQVNMYTIPWVYPPCLTGSTIIWNFGTFLQDCMMSHTKEEDSSFHLSPFMKQVFFTVMLHICDVLRKNQFFFPTLQIKANCKFLLRIDKNLNLKMNWNVGSNNNA